MQKVEASEWRKGWPIVVSAGVGMCACTIHIYSLGALIEPIQRAMGWDRQQVTLGMTIISVISILVQPGAGVLIDRVGVRRVALPGLVVYGASLACLSLATPSYWTWVAGWALVGVAYSGIQSVWVTGVAGHFKVRRGMAMALSMMGTGITSIACPVIATSLNETLGWRAAYLGLASFPILVALPLAVAVFRDARFAAPAASEIAAPPVDGLTIRAVLRSRHYWQLAGASIIMTGAIGGLSVHMVPMLHQAGFTPAAAAGLASLIGVGIIVGRLLGGYCLDRIHASVVAVVALSLPALSCLTFLGGVEHPLLLSAAVLCIGLAVGAETDCIAYLTGKFFGMKNFGFVFGSLSGFITFGLGFGPWIGGVFHDAYHDYRYFQMAIVAALATAAFLIGSMGRYPKDDTAGEGALPAPAH